MKDLCHVVLNEFRHKRILVVGDLMLDRYIRGSATRLSPEAPVPVLRSASRHDTLGGAANVALNVVSLGGKCDIAGFLGNDEPATRFRELCAGAGIGQSGLVSRDGEPTTVKTRILSGNHQLLRIDEEIVQERSEEAYSSLFAAIETGIKNARPDAIVVSDYAKGVVSGRLTALLMPLASKLGIPVYVDPKGTDYTKYQGAFLIKPNRIEMTEFARRWGWSMDDLPSAAQELRKAAGLEYVALTLSEHGMAVVSESGVKQIPAQASEVFDVTGAGDTLMAGLVLATASALPVEDAATLANTAAAIAIAHVGSYAVRAGELMQGLRAQSFGPMERKVYDLAELTWVADQWRVEGKRVVFTNGCFDIIHAGHTMLLQDARAMGDRLIVGLNSDESIRRLKGDGRPLTALPMRTAVLGAMQPVDAIVVFEEDTPLKVIEALKPDVLVKGGDYNRSTIVGSDIVEQYGGRVAVIPITLDLSTTKLAAALQKL